MSMRGSMFLLLMIFWISCYLAMGVYFMFLGGMKKEELNGVITIVIPKIRG